MLLIGHPTEKVLLFKAGKTRKNAGRNNKNPVPRAGMKYGSCVCEFQGKTSYSRGHLLSFKNHCLMGAGP